MSLHCKSLISSEKVNKRKVGLSDSLSFCPYSNPCFFLTTRRLWKLKKDKSFNFPKKKGKPDKETKYGREKYNRKKLNKRERKRKKRGIVDQRSGKERKEKEMKKGEKEILKKYKIKMWEKLKKKWEIEREKDRKNVIKEKE